MKHGAKFDERTTSEKNGTKSKLLRAKVSVDSKQAEHTSEYPKNNRISACKRINVGQLQHDRFGIQKHPKLRCKQSMNLVCTRC